MPLRVLIVEDEPLIALHLEGILEDAGHTVVGIAPDMIRAVEIAAAFPRLDLAIMDVDLATGSSGVEVARRLREDHDVASLFVSAQLTDEVMARAMAWQPVGFIAKPFMERDILRAVAAAPACPPSR